MQNKNNPQKRIFHIFDSSFIENEVFEKGGAIYIENSPITLTNCIFQANQAKEGGAIFINSESILNKIINFN